MLWVSLCFCLWFRCKNVATSHKHVDHVSRKQHSNINWCINKAKHLIIIKLGSNTQHGNCVLSSVTKEISKLYQKTSMFLYCHHFDTARILGDGSVM